MTLLKHSDVEAGVKWWFLYRVADDRFSLESALDIGINALRDIKVVRFVKRFGSEEELDFEAAVKYGATPVACRR